MWCTAPAKTCELPRTARILRTTVALIPLTRSATDGITLHTDRASARSKRNEVHAVSVIRLLSGQCSVNAQRPAVPLDLPDAGRAPIGRRVAFLVSESREVMNVRQASAYLGISPDTLYRYITEGEIPAFKLGNRWKLRKTILDRWMERKITQAHARRR
jgi:excisionase family DNA binding protein